MPSHGPATVSFSRQSSASVLGSTDSGGFRGWPLPPPCGTWPRSGNPHGQRRGSKSVKWLDYVAQQVAASQEAGEAWAECTLATLTGSTAPLPQSPASPAPHERGGRGWAGGRRAVTALGAASQVPAAPLQETRQGDKVLSFEPNLHQDRSGARQQRQEEVPPCAGLGLGDDGGGSFSGGPPAALRASALTSSPAVGADGNAAGPRLRGVLQLSPSMRHALDQCRPVSAVHTIPRAEDDDAEGPTLVIVPPRGGGGSGDSGGESLPPAQAAPRGARPAPGHCGLSSAQARMGDGDGDALARGTGAGGRCVGVVALAAAGGDGAGVGSQAAAMACYRAGDERRAGGGLPSRRSHAHAAACDPRSSRSDGSAALASRERDGGRPHGGGGTTASASIHSAPLPSPGRDGADPRTCCRPAAPAAAAAGGVGGAGGAQVAAYTTVDVASLRAAYALRCATAAAAAAAASSSRRPEMGSCGSPLAGSSVAGSACLAGGAPGCTSLNGASHNVIGGRGRGRGGGGGYPRPGPACGQALLGGGADGSDDGDGSAFDSSVEDEEDEEDVSDVVNHLSGRPACRPPPQRQPLQQQQEHVKHKRANGSTSPPPCVQILAQASAARAPAPGHDSSAACGRQKAPAAAAAPAAGAKPGCEGAKAAATDSVSAAALRKPALCGSLRRVCSKIAACFAA